MIDLTGAHYLGLAHAHDSLAPWRQLTSGRPALLEAGEESRAIARGIATLVGLPRATLAPSTLHIVIDLYAALARRVRHIHVDACTYPVTRWGLERAQVRGVEIHPYRSMRELEAQLATGSDHAFVCDAICMVCRRSAPLRELQQLARRSRSWLIVDDSQGIGLLGAQPTPAMPYGRGGGGTLRWSDAERERVIAIASLAKAFAAPLAFLAASRSTVEWFERHAATRVHASPCNAAALASASAALQTNMACGDALRAGLVARVRTFRDAVAERGGTLSAGMFPVQATPPIPVAAVRALDDMLLRRGVRGIRLRQRAGLGQLAFIINADHDPATLARAGEVVGHLLAISSRPHRLLARAARPGGAEAHAP